jgi:hypothetical protein
MLPCPQRLDSADSLLADSVLSGKFRLGFSARTNSQYVSSFQFVRAMTLPARVQPSTLTRFREIHRLIAKMEMMRITAASIIAVMKDEFALACRPVRELPCGMM